jgi:carnitine O-acetyltransferase
MYAAKRRVVIAATLVATCLWKLNERLVGRVKSMLDRSTSSHERVRLFREAVKQHGQDMKLASNGLGIDRHFFGSWSKYLAFLHLLTFGRHRTPFLVFIGLKKAMEEGEAAPELFSDPLFNRSATWTMSTSQVYMEKAPAYGWGNVTADGIGVPYMIHSGMFGGKNHGFEISPDTSW